METKANYVRVGIFTVLAFTLGAIILILFTHIKESSYLQPLDIRIPGSVSGLAEGSFVFFNGIRIGTIQKLSLDKNNPNMVIAETLVDKRAPITRSTQASLGYQGVTGVAYIELKGGSLNEPLLLKQAEEKGMVARIDAAPSSMNDLLGGAQDISRHVATTVKELEELILQIKNPLTKTIENSQRISEKMDKNVDIIDDTQKILKSVAQITTKVDKIVDNVNQVLAEKGPNSILPKLQKTILSIQKTAENLDKNIGPIAINVRNITGRAFTDIDNSISSINRSIARIEQAISDLEKNPQRLLWGGPNDVPRYNGGR